MDVRLTQAEAEQLIDAIKKAVISALAAPEKGKKVDFDAKTIYETPSEMFVITIFRGKINRDKLSYTARIKIKNTILLELHINPSGKHSNPDGTLIEGSHWHVYKEGYDNHCAYVAEDVYSNDFVTNTLLFFEKFNIIDRPVITDQLEL